MPDQFPSCPVCGYHKVSSLIDEHDHIDHIMDQLLKMKSCNRCGVVFMWPLPKDEGDRREGSIHSIHSEQTGGII